MLIITKKRSAKELPNNEAEEDLERTTHNKRYILPEERQQITEELRLVPKTDVYFWNYWWINLNFEKDINLMKKDYKLLIN